MIAIKWSISISTPKIKENYQPWVNQIIGWFKIKTQSKQQGTNSKMFTNKSMTLRIHFLNYEAGTCNYSETFQYA